MNTDKTRRGYLHCVTKKIPSPSRGGLGWGWGGGCVYPTPIPAFPLKGKEFLWKFCDTVQLSVFIGVCL